MSKIVRPAVAVAVLVSVAVGAIACASTTSTTALGPTTTATQTGAPTQTPATTSANATIAAIRAYADPATMTTLQGLSEDNLARYTQNADAQFKAAVTQSQFDQISASVNSQLGSFISITFLSTGEQSGYTIVHYQAKYSKKEVGVRMVFDKDHLVAGQFFE